MSNAAVFSNPEEGDFRGLQPVLRVNVLCSDCQQIIAQARRRRQHVIPDPHPILAEHLPGNAVAEDEENAGECDRTPAAVRLVTDGMELARAVPQVPITDLEAARRPCFFTLPRRGGLGFGGFATRSRLSD